jgi:hypothetical protein
MTARSGEFIASLGVLVALLLMGAGSASASLVPNGDFEVDADANSAPDDWFRGGTTGYVTTDDSNGSGVASVTSGNGGDWRSTAFAVAANEQLTWSVDYKVSAGATGTFRADLRFFTGQAGDGGTAGSFQGEDVHLVDVSTVTPDVWQTLGPFTLNVPAGSFPPVLVPHFADVRISAGLFGPALTGELRLDNINVTRIPEPATATMAISAILLGLAVCRRIRKV